jgi:hypothetical protein
VEVYLVTQAATLLVPSGTILGVVAEADVAGLAAAKITATGASTLDTGATRGLAPALNEQWPMLIGLIVALCLITAAKAIVAVETRRPPSQNARR